MTHYGNAHAHLLTCSSFVWCVLLTMADSECKIHDENHLVQWLSVPIFPVCLQTWSIGALHESFLLKICRTYGMSKQRRMQPGSTMSESSAGETQSISTPSSYIYYDILTSKIPAAQYLELPCKDLKGSTPRIERAWVARSPPYLYLPMIEEKRYIILPSPLVCIQNLNPITIANFYSLWY